MLAAGTVLFDKYRIDRAIGKGGMAQVYAATHLQLHEPVAIKTLLPELMQNEGVVQRFMREARAAVRLRGEHVARVIDVGTLPWGPPYMVMELLTGLDLAELLKQRPDLPSTEAVDCVLQACEALAEAHASGIVHRDIKPSNLFVTRRPDGSPLLKVLDFGISKVGFEEQVNLTLDSVVGTPSYMSPEQLRQSAHVDARTDIWSLGIVLYRLLAGVRPFKGDSISALAIQAATEPTPLLPRPVAPGLDAIVYRCLEKDPNHRFQTVAELAFALAPYAGDARAASIVIERTQGIQRWTPPQVTAPPSAPMHPIEPTTLGSSAGAVQPTAPPRRRLGWIAVLAGAMAVGVAVALVATSGGAPSSSSESVQPTVAPETPAAAPPAEPTITEPAPAEPTITEPVPAPEPTITEPVPAAAPEPATAVPEPEATPSRPTRTKRVPKRPATKKDPKPSEPTPTPTPKRPPGNPLDTRT